MPSGLRRAPLTRPHDDLADLVSQVFASSGDLDYWHTVRYANAAAPVVEELATMVRTGHSDVARQPLADAVELLLSTLDRADDSAGALDDLLNRLLANHAEACCQAPDEPERLAGWLLQVQFDGGRWCPIDIGGYAAALGPQGLSQYRSAIARRWSADPGDLSARDAVERLARWERDVPTLIEVIGGGLRHPAQYGRLARALAEIGETATAREWAQRGLAAHPDDPPGAGLRDFLNRNPTTH